MSRWSYSIYLSHIPILFVIYAAFGAARAYTVINILSKLLVLAACVGVSKLIYTYFELRLMAMRPSENH